MIKKENITRVLYSLMLFFSLVPDFFAIGDLKPMYIVFFLLCLRAFREKIKIPPKYVMLFGIYSITISFLLSGLFGIDRLLFNYAFGIFVVTIFYNISCKENIRNLISCLKIVWVGLAITIVINDFLQYHRFIEFHQLKLAHPYINTVVTGGVNLEATWLSLLSITFINDRRKWFPILFSLGVSAVYASRVGILSVAIIMMLLFLKNRQSNLGKKLISLVSISAVIVFIGVQTDLFSDVLSRFGNIGHDPGSLGRFRLWSGVIPTMLQYPFGVGLGNVIDSITKTTGIAYVENNLHCLPVQMFCECGILGGFFYIALWGIFFFKEYKCFGNDEIKTILLVYFLLSMLQFRGGETIFFSLLGAYLGTRRKSY